MMLWLLLALIILVGVYLAIALMEIANRTNVIKYKSRWFDNLINRADTYGENWKSYGGEYDRSAAFMAYEEAQAMVRGIVKARQDRRDAWKWPMILVVEFREDRAEERVKKLAREDRMQLVLNTPNPYVQVEEKTL